MEVVQCGLCGKQVPIHKVLNPTGANNEPRTCTSCLFRASADATAASRRPSLMDTIMGSRRPSVGSSIGGGSPRISSGTSSPLPSSLSKPPALPPALPPPCATAYNELASANPSQLCAGPRTPPWLKAIGLVEFDLELGIVVRYLYPALPFSLKQETEIAFLTFPDANLVEDGDSLHDFVYAYNPSECDPNRSTIKRPAHKEDKAGADASSTTKDAKTAGYTEDHNEMFCTAIFRQKKDPTVTRGARQNAIVVMGDYPFPGIYRQLLSQLVVYLETPNADPEQFLVAAHTAVSSWPTPLPNHVYSDLPFIGSTLTFTTPHYLTSHVWSVPQPSLELSVHRLSEVQRLIHALVGATNGGEVPVAAISAAVKAALRAPTGGVAYPSILTQYGWDVTSDRFDPPLDHNSIVKLVEAMQDARLSELVVVGAGPAPLESNSNRSRNEEAASDTLTAFTARSESPAGSVQSHDSGGASAVTLKNLENHFKQGTGPSGAMVAYQNQALGRLQTYFITIKEAAKLRPAWSDTCRPATPDQRRYVFSELQLNSAFYPHITKLWKFWELLITGSPVAVVGPNGPNVSAVVLSLASLIAPLHFTGLLRPYLTINNREIDHCIRPIAQPSCLVAVTNPFFVKHLARWPHFLCVGEVDGDVQTHKTLPSDSEKRPKQQFKLKNRFFCSRHYLVKTDKTHHAEWMRAPPLSNGLYIDSPAHTSTCSATIRQTFVSLTHEFLQPVRNFVLQTLEEERPYFLDEGEFRLLFCHSNIMERIQRPAPASFSRFKTVAEALEVYEMFITSPSFQVWLQGVVHARYRELVIEDLHTLQDALLLCPTPTRRHEVLSKLQWDFELALREPLLDLAYLQKLSTLCTEIPALRLRLVSDDELL